MSNATDAFTELGVTETTEETFTIWALKLIYMLLTKYTWCIPLIIGVPGNMISIMITCKKSNRHISSCTYMTALAVADTMVLICLSWAQVLLHWGFAKTLSVEQRENMYRLVLLLRRLGDSRVEPGLICCQLYPQNKSVVYDTVC
jgi:hypothetical protein